MQGLPQGSVLAPVLFLFYINELAKVLPDNLVPALYADDVSLLASGRTTQEIETVSQDAVDIVVNWSREWKLILNGSKSETSLFSLGKTDKTWQPKITINGQIARFEPNPRFLGVTLDRTLTFGEHVGLISARALQKKKILNAVAHSSWGWRKGDLRKVFLAHIRPLLNYAGCAWQPWLSQTSVDRLERVQDSCLRAVTSQALSTPTEALHAEAEVSSMRSCISANCLRSREKALRLPQTTHADAPSPRRRLADSGAGETPGQLLRD